MDIAALSIGLSTANVRQDASLALMKKTMNQAEVHNQGMMNMLQQSSNKAAEHAAQPHLGGSIDIKL